MTYYVNTDIDLVEVIQMEAIPVDRIQQADCLSFTPDIPNVKGKTIILNRHFENSEPKIEYLAKTNKIINRDKLNKNFPYEPYKEELFDIVSLSNKEVSIMSEELNLILLDDLLISNRKIIW